jgi:hypothetical protein
MTAAPLGLGGAGNKGRFQPTEMVTEVPDRK